MPDALKALLASTDTLAAKAQGAVLSATRDIRKEILYLAGELDIAGSADAREAVFAKVTKRMVRLGRRLSALEQAAANQAQDAAGEATESDLGKLIRISPRRAKEIVRTIQQRGGGGMAATMTQAMNENIVTALREATVSAFREQAVAGMTARDLEKVILDKWKAAAKDPKNLQFVDRSGKVWDTQTYINMNVRTNAMHVYNETLMQDIANTTGGDLVMVSRGGDPNCSLCFPWEGRILSITGKTKGFPKYDEAVAAGIFHPNCVHTLEPVDEDLDAAEIELQRGHLPPANATRKKLDEQRYDLDIAREMAQGKDATQAKIAVDRQNLADNIRHGLITENAEEIVAAMTDEQVNELCPDGNPPQFMPSKYNNGEDGWNKGKKGGVVYLHRTQPTVEKLLAATGITAGKPVAPYTAKITPPSASKVDPKKDEPETPESRLRRLIAEMRQFSDQYFGKEDNFENQAQGTVDEIASYVKKIGDIGNTITTYAAKMKRDAAWVLTNIPQYQAIAQMLDEFQATADGISQSRADIGGQAADLTEAVTVDDASLDEAGVTRIRNKITVANGKLNRAAAQLAKQSESTKRAISARITQAENLAAQAQAVIDALTRKEDSTTNAIRPTPESLGIDIEAVRAMPLEQALKATTKLNDGAMEAAQARFDAKKREADDFAETERKRINDEMGKEVTKWHEKRSSLPYDTTDDQREAAIGKLLKEIEGDKTVKKAFDAFNKAEDKKFGGYRASQGEGESRQDWLYHNFQIMRRFTYKMETKCANAKAKAWREVEAKCDAMTKDAQIICAFRDAKGGSEVNSACVESRQKQWAVAEAILNQIVSKDVMPERMVYVQATKDSRSFRRGGTINMNCNSGTGTYLHEFAHFIEGEKPHIHERCAEFLKMRAERSGITQAESLKKLTGIDYRRNEVTLKDDFFDPYCGKVYVRDSYGYNDVISEGGTPATSGRGYKVDSTELLSMGIQQLYENPVKFYKNDREYFDFTVNLLQGNL